MGGIGPIFQGVVDLILQAHTPISIFLLMLAAYVWIGRHHFVGAIEILIAGIIIFTAGTLVSTIHL